MTFATTPLVKARFWVMPMRPPPVAWRPLHQFFSIVVSSDIWTTAPASAPIPTPKFLNVDRKMSAVAFSPMQRPHQRPPPSSTETEMKRDTDCQAPMAAQPAVLPVTVSLRDVDVTALACVQGYASLHRDVTQPALIAGVDRHRGLNAGHAHGQSLDREVPRRRYRDAEGRLGRSGQERGALLPDDLQGRRSPK